MSLSRRVLSLFATSLLLSVLAFGCVGSDDRDPPDPGGEGEGEGECEDECSADQRSCQGTSARLECQLGTDGCYRWSGPIACAADESCASGRCQPGCANDCAAGSAECYGAGLRTCVDPDGDGCYSWGAETPCEEGQSCASGRCVAGCNSECSEGALSCQGNTVRICGEFDEDACLEWGTLRECAVGETCSLGTCSATCGDECAQGSRACAEGGYRECGNFDEDECVEWSQVIACGEGEGCSGGICSAVCANECATSARRCSADGGGTVECGQFDEDECRDWGPVVPCGEGTTCSLGECTETCQDECSAGSLRCGEGGVERCGAFDADPCLEWSQPSACPEGETCTGGICAADCQHECVGGARQCAEGGVRTCGDFDPDLCSEWGPVTPCPANQICSQGQCQDTCSDECAEGSRRCSLGGVQVCGEYDGDECREWSEPSPCPEGQSCSSGRCEAQCSDECAADAVRCSAGGVQRCGSYDADPCLEWGLSTPCPEGSVCSQGRCEERCSDECAVDTQRCVGDAVQRCGEFDGDPCLEWGEGTPCGDAQVCSGGRCLDACQNECAAGARRCSASGVQICADSPQGCTSWGAVLGEGFVVGAGLPCAEGLTCSAGSCELVCSDECAVGEARCAPGGRQVCGQYDGDACREWSEVAGCPAGESCSNGECRVDCQDECQAGDLRCSADGQEAAEACGQSDEDACLEWGVAVPCGEGELCEAGVCAACVPQEEVVDGVDNDCDGVIDEGAPGTLAGWCILQHPGDVSTTEGFATLPIYGRVYAQGMTEAAGAHPGVIAELGHGPQGSDPASAEGWVWNAARYSVQVENNDEYVGTLNVLTPGVYDYAYRFSVDGGENWVHCDRDGLAEGGYTAAQAGTLLVGPGVWWANLQWPQAAEVLPGSPADFYGQVFQEGLTDSPGAAAGLSVQAGFGPDGSDPRSPDSGWAWVDATYNGDKANNNEEYRATLTPPLAGRFDVAFRYSRDGGDSWVYADLDGSQNGYSPLTSADLLVRAELPPLAIGWAGNWGQYFSREANCAAGREAIAEPVVVDSWVQERAACRQVVAEVYVAGHTDQDGSDPERVTAQAVRVPVIDGVDGEPQSFALAFYGRTGNNHEFRWDLPVADFSDPDVPRDWHFWFLFSGDGGETWYRIAQGDGPEGGAARSMTYAF